MKKMPVITILLFVAACAPLFDQEIMKEGQRNFPFNELREHPEQYKGKLYIVGGVIVETRLTRDGSQIEVLSKPVGKNGTLEDSPRTMGRFLAVLPEREGLLDPLIYKKGREITLAGTFLETRKNKIDEYEYLYPLFEIRQIRLWDEPNSLGYPYPYPNYPYYRPFYPYWYNPYWGPWPAPPGWW